MIFIFILGTTNAAFIRDDSLNIVMDTTRNIIWQDDSVHTVSSWESAINPTALTNNKCANLSFANFSDWRLPNINELKTIIDYTRTDPAINTVFKNIPASTNAHLDFLSSTTASPSTNVWYVNFWNGAILNQNKDGSDFPEDMYIMCVRNR
jgi:hypothetical protein